mmetsp:Transcript_27169/g.45321  ORF Transcript_27169/g.45321 Transcript_27169/m.45321 type:complete len:220 (-) Transcript_27169:1304-1963(-)
MSKKNDSNHLTEAQWNKGVGASPGFKLWKEWLPPEEASSCFATVNDDDAFPWDIRPKLYGEVLQQHAYSYMPTRKNLQSSKEGLKVLEQLRTRIAEDFQCKVHAVFCNRFVDPDHSIDWHRDKYGVHIFVLSLGNSRSVEYRHDKTKDVTRYEPCAGDLYFMSLQHNKQYNHRVLSAGENRSGTRISFVFMISAPFNMKKYKIGFGDKVFGTLNAMLAG